MVLLRMDLDERRLLNNQPIGELNQHLRATGFRRMDAAIEPVDWFRGSDDSLRLLVGGFARIG